METDTFEERLEKLLQTYTLEEILEYNDITIFEAVSFLFYEGFLTLPPEPL